MGAKRATWAMPAGYTGWAQGGRATATGAHPKCGAHYVAKAKATTTACTRLQVRGATAPVGFTHYGLRWYPVAGQAAATGAVCKACALVAAKAGA